MTDRPSDGPELVVDAVLRASRALVAITARSLSSVSDDVTLPQLRALVTLRTRGPRTVSALAEHLDVHASTTTRMCNRLVTRGLVNRVPSAVDRREVLVTLSTTGRQLVDDVTNRRRDEIDTVVGRVPPEDRLTVVTALETFARAAGDDYENDPVPPEMLAPDLRTLAPPPPEEQR